MDALTEKKWFVYLGDHHEGPFSLKELRNQFSQGQTTKENFVWAEGMPDWKIIAEVPELETLFHTPPDVEPGIQTVIENQEKILESSVLNAQDTSSTLLEPPVLEKLEQVAEPLPLEPEPMGIEQLEPNMDLAVLLEATVLEEAPSPDQETSPSFASLPPLPSQPVKTELIVADEKTGELNKAELEKTRLISLQGNPAGKNSKLKFGKWAKRTLFIFSIAALGGAYFQGHLDAILTSPAIENAVESLLEWSGPYLLPWADRFPRITQWISPIPKLEDVNPGEYEELKDAAKWNLKTQGAKVSTAVSKNDPTLPYFYVASNLPDGTHLKVVVIGVTGTLLNHLSFSTQVEAVIIKKLAKTAVIRFSDGRLLPRGEYKVYVLPAANQPPELKSWITTSSVKIPPELPKSSKILVFKSYFLGGTRDEIYLSRLKEYHSKLQARATSELTELKQFAATLESQFNSTQTKFSLLRKGKQNLKQKKRWDSFQKDWMKLQVQLNQIFKAFTPEMVRQNYFYGTLYQLTQQVGQSIDRVHGLHQAFFDQKQDLRTFEIQLGEATSSAQSSINLFKVKIDQASKIPPTPTGMPRRDGV